jgi:hypothetical protein
MIENHHIEQVRTALLAEGFTNSALIEDLIDHILCKAETEMANQKDIKSSIENAMQEVLPEDPETIERDLNYFITQKRNIMIRKIAYLGGYISALCLCLALFFVAMTISDNLQVGNQQELMEAELITSPEITREEQNAIMQTYYDRKASYKIKAVQDMEASQALILAAIALFSVTYLPFRFYDGYLKSLNKPALS